MEVQVHAAVMEIQPRSTLTDEEVSVLWHEAQEQPFRFARLIERVVREKLNESNAR